MAWTTPGTATAGEVLTAAFWNENVRDNSNALRNSIIRLGFQTRGTGGADNYTVDQSSVASAVDIFSSDISWTADGTSSYLIEAFCPTAATAGSNQTTRMVIVTGSGTSLGYTEIYNSAGSSTGPLFVRFWYTPSAGSAAVNARGTKDGAGSGSLRFGTGYLPGYIAVYGPPTT
jgi:hypothetical protein